MDEFIKKADVLIEALPYIKRFFGKVVVIKFGGSMLEDDIIRKRILEDIVFMSFVGIRPVLVHGGGPSITAKMKELGKKAEFVNGYRVTDEETVSIVDRVLSELNKGIVSEIKELGAHAESFVSKDKVIYAEKDTEHGDLGYIGRIVDINTDKLNAVIHRNIVPVISPVGFGRDNKFYNVNGDRAGAKIAAWLNACKYALLTNIKGIMKDVNDKSTLMSTISEDEVKDLIAKKIINTGMIPKVTACIKALDKGVKKAHIIDARIPHALLLEIFTDKGIGTEIFQ